MTATDSRCCKHDVDGHSLVVTTIYPFRQSTQGKRLSLAHSLLCRSAVGQNPRNFWDFGNLATIVFALNFNMKIHF